MTITELLEKYDVWVADENHKNVRAGWTGTDCPQCSPDTQKALLGFAPDGKWCTCWACGHQPLFSTLAALTGERYGAIKELVGDLEDAYAPTEEFKKRGKLVLPNGLGPFREAHRKYLRGRGFDPDELVAKWQLQGIGTASWLPWRIFIPITLNGKTVSWTTRAIGEQIRPRYFQAPPEKEEISAKQILFGEDYCLHTMVVCEGPMDAMRIGYGAVATLGLGHSAAQCARIARYTNRVICFDAEEGAQKRAQRLCNDLSVFHGKTTNIILETDKDAAGARASEIQRLQKEFLKGSVI